MSMLRAADNHYICAEDIQILDLCGRVCGKSYGCYSFVAGELTDLNAAEDSG